MFAELSGDVAPGGGNPERFGKTHLEDVGEIVGTEGPAGASTVRPPLPDDQDVRWRSPPCR